MSPTTGRPSLRDRTRDEVFALIRDSRDLTRSALVELTGLPSSTIGHAVSRLLAEGRVTESAPPAKGPGSGSGRPGSILNAVATTTRTGAIDFGHRHFRVALGDDAGNVIDEEIVQLNVDQSPVRGLDAAAASLRALGARNSVSALTCVAAGVPGPIEEDTGLVCSTTTLSNWAGIYPARELERRLGVPALVSNDASAGALGELHHGAGRGHRDFLYIKASHGIGAGMVIRGELFEGGTGFAGEIGHMMLVPGAPMGRRSVEQNCSRTAVVDRLVSLIRANHKSRLTDLTKGDLSQVRSKLVAQAYKDGDKLTRRVIDECAEMIGCHIGSCVTLLSLPLVVMGGGLSEALGEDFVKLVERAARASAFPSRCKDVRVVVSRRLDDACQLGAALLAR